MKEFLKTIGYGMVALTVALTGAVVFILTANINPLFAIVSVVGFGFVAGFMVHYTTDI